ncbi:MAG: M48 family metalloprotease [Acidobacteria bacterium]|nr:M48 family metalloprotease [Acidobacteriota bacterium]
MAHRHGFKEKAPRGGILLALLSLMLAAGLAQTRISAPANKYSPADDFQLGRQAAAEAEKQLPILRDRRVAGYVEEIGQRLLAAVPEEFRHPEFNYYFRVVDARDINAFALPGGPMYVNRGMIEAAGSEGEAAGVMAHELSHVVLRHGTAQATKAEKLQFGAIAGAILGSILGGGIGEIVSQGTQFGLGAVFLRFSRDFEKQADLLGAQIMAGAGYDPRGLARMFETIEKQRRSGGPQWLSDHPNPGNRSAYINEEARRLTIEDPVRDSGEFRRVQAQLRSLPRARSAEEIQRSGGRRSEPGSVPDAGSGVPTGRVPAPSSRYQTYWEGDLFGVSVPDNWQELPGNYSVTFAPEGAYGQVDGRSVFTHGVQLGMTRNETHGLRQATEEFVDGLMQGNPRLRRQGGYRRGSLAGRPSLAVTFRNVSEATRNPEIVAVRTMLLRDGNLFYAIAVAPEEEYARYRSAFDSVLRSLQIRD